VIFTTDDRVTITDTDDRHYGEQGIVEDHFYGMSGARVYLITLDGRQDVLPFLAAQLDLGEGAA
jgi:hypothetical protein